MASINFGLFADYLNGANLAGSVGTNFLGVIFIILGILLIPNENPQANKDRSILAAGITGALALLGVLNGGIGIFIIAIVLLWAIFANIK